MEPFELEGRRYRFRKLGSADTFEVMTIVADVLAWGSQDGGTYLAHFDQMLTRMGDDEANRSAMASNFFQPIITFLTPLFGIPVAKDKIYAWVASTLEVEAVTYSSPDGAEVGEEPETYWQRMDVADFDDPDLIPMGADLELFARLAGHPNMTGFAKQVQKLRANNPFTGLFTTATETTPPVNGEQKVNQEPVIDREAFLKA